MEVDTRWERFAYGIIVRLVYYLSAHNFNPINRRTRPRLNARLICGICDLSVRRPRFVYSIERSGQRIVEIKAQQRVCSIEYVFGMGMTSLGKCSLVDPYFGYFEPWNQVEHSGRGPERMTSTSVYLNPQQHVRYYQQSKCSVFRSNAVRRWIQFERKKARVNVIFVVMHSLIPT